MARIRSIKPDAFRSDTLSQVPRGVRWTFAGLWTYLDDEGRGRDNLRLIKAELYPLDDDVTVDVLDDDLRQLEKLDTICRYSVDGKHYLHAVNWKQHQSINRPKESTNPPCMRHHGHDSDDAGSEHGHDSDSTLLEGKGKEQGTGNSDDASLRDASLFDEFWQAYPRKTDKANAKKAWAKAVKKKNPREIIAAARGYAATKPDPKFTAHASTWLNGERWDDELARSPTEPATRHVPLEVPSWVDPDNPEQYAAWLRSAG